MKRSEINRLINHARATFSAHGWTLPPFADYAPDKWANLDSSYDEIKRCMMGWDITDFGSGDYYNIGLMLFTLRNGDLKDPDNRKTYAEKLMLVREGQVTPCHFHWNKMEDIINRGGGNLMVKVYDATEDDKLSDDPVTVRMDGRAITVPAGTVLKIRPGESITMHQRLYHSFWGEPGAGDVVVGEVSKVNDDNADNRFYEPCGRFPDIEEDEPARVLLCNEYPA